MGAIYMQKGKIMFSLFCAVVIAIGMGTEIGSAYTDNANILGGMEYKKEPVYDYLNSNNFRFYKKKALNAGYITNNNSEFFIIMDDIPKGGESVYGFNGQLAGVIFMKSGHKTDKGAEVGMKLKDLQNIYGQVYPMNSYNVYNKNINTGCYREGTYIYKSKWGDRKFSYYEIGYRDQNGGEIDFLVDKASKKIRAITFQHVKAHDYPYFWHSPTGWAGEWGIMGFIMPELEADPLTNTWNGIAGIFK